MRGSTMGLVAAALIAGLAGCSLPEVLPMAAGTTAGPSPYGPWYEQHWATNSVLLAAADQPDEEWEGDEAAEGLPGDEEFGVDEELGADAAPAAAEAAIEANAGSPDLHEEFSDSTPFQFPASAYSAEPPAGAPASPDASQPATPAVDDKVVPPSGGPIRY